MCVGVYAGVKKQDYKITDAAFHGLLLLKKSRLLKCINQQAVGSNLLTNQSINHILTIYH